MFESVAAAPPDPILGLTEAFKKDERGEKINLTIGVFRDADGATPVLKAVKQAEKKLLEEEDTKGYLGIEGLGHFLEKAQELTLGGLVSTDRVVAVQAPGGTGALRNASELIGANFAGRKIWISTPTWPNHNAIFTAAGLNTSPYPYLAADKKSLDFGAMMDTLEREAKAGDLICLHACCHNPTGIDPSLEQWQDIAELTAARGMLPIVDFAYHGFGDGLEEDRAGLAELMKQHEELLICSSYSKNFGLYSERIGALFIVCSTADSCDNVRSSMKKLVRTNYSTPPRHGGAIVATVLEHEELRQVWLEELAEMRERIHGMRRAFVDFMMKKQSEMDFEFLLEQRGMFSFSGLNPVQVDWLRTQKGIYIVGSGRINVAGVTMDNIDYLTDSIAAALQLKS